MTGEQERMNTKQIVPKTSSQKGHAMAITRHQVAVAISDAAEETLMWTLVAGIVTGLSLVMGTLAPDLLNYWIAWPLPISPSDRFFLTPALTCLNGFLVMSLLIGLRTVWLIYHPTRQENRSV